MHNVQKFFVFPGSEQGVLLASLMIFTTNGVVRGLYRNIHHAGAFFVIIILSYLMLGARVGFLSAARKRIG